VLGHSGLMCLRVVHDCCKHVCVAAPWAARALLLMLCLGFGATHIGRAMLQSQVVGLYRDGWVHVFLRRRCKVSSSVGLGSIPLLRQSVTACRLGGSLGFLMLALAHLFGSACQATVLDLEKTVTCCSLC
jgi:hypothetical protein